MSHISSKIQDPIGEFGHMYVCVQEFCFFSYIDRLIELAVITPLTGTSSGERCIFASTLSSSSPPLHVPPSPSFFLCVLLINKAENARNSILPVCTSCTCSKSSVPHKSIYRHILHIYIYHCTCFINCLIKMDVLPILTRSNIDVFCSNQQ